MATEQEKQHDTSGYQPPTQMITSDVPPNHTIYINNLNEKIKKAQLKKSLYAVFSQFGHILDIVCSRTLRMKGQAWVVFEDVASATNALRQMQGFPFYDKPMRIHFAKKKSDAVAKRDGTYVPPAKRSAEAQEEAEKRTAVSTDSSAEPVMIPAPPQPQHIPPNKILFAQNLPSEITSEMLSTLFGQYHGFQEVRMVPGKGVAFIEFDSIANALPALQGLHNYKVSPTQNLQLSYAKK